MQGSISAYPFWRFIDTIRQPSDFSFLAISQADISISILPLSSDGVMPLAMKLTSLKELVCEGVHFLTITLGKFLDMFPPNLSEA